MTRNWENEISKDVCVFNTLADPYLQKLAVSLENDWGPAEQEIHHKAIAAIKEQQARVAATPLVAVPATRALSTIMTNFCVELHKVAPGA